MNWNANRRMALLALTVFALDQAAKAVALHFLGPDQEHNVIDGFFKFVLWRNTGAAWSLLYGRNGLLAAVSLGALAALFFWRKHFHAHTLLGQLSLGLIFGGIAGNLFDRLDPQRQHVIDFLRFYLYRRNGEEIGFPAFNLADSAICIGVGLLIFVSWRLDHEDQGGMARDEIAMSKE
ncbi:MAG TPA: signal peptidase II [Verrucomicrobiae bacterium]|jgi:signal peptidase II|nr:signal peptidase II [Verrucomicrobiae bacterium]